MAVRAFEGTSPRVAASLGSKGRTSNSTRPISDPERSWACSASTPTWLRGRDVPVREVTSVSRPIGLAGFRSANSARGAGGVRHATRGRRRPRAPRCSRYRRREVRACRKRGARGRSSSEWRALLSGESWLSEPSVGRPLAAAMPLRTTPSEANARRPIRIWPRSFNRSSHLRSLPATVPNIFLLEALAKAMGTLRVPCPLIFAGEIASAPFLVFVYISRNYTH